MLKSISAALLAVSVLAAPALAAGSAKTTQAPVIKAEQVKKPAIKAAQVKQVKPSVLKAPHISHQARLILIRGRGLIHIAPPLPSDFRSGPHAIASPMATGRMPFQGCEITSLRIPLRR